MANSSIIAVKLTAWQLEQMLTSQPASSRDAGPWPLPSVPVKALCEAYDWEMRTRKPRYQTKHPSAWATSYAFRRRWLYDVAWASCFSSMKTPTIERMRRSFRRQTPSSSASWRSFRVLPPPSVASDSGSLSPALSEPPLPLSPPASSPSSSSCSTLSRSTPRQSSQTTHLYACEMPLEMATCEMTSWPEPETPMLQLSQPEEQSVWDPALHHSLQEGLQELEAWLDHYPHSQADPCPSPCPDPLA